jgi:hypothetical protein
MPEKLGIKFGNILALLAERPGSCDGLDVELTRHVDQLRRHRFEDPTIPGARLGLTSLESYHWIETHLKDRATIWALTVLASVAAAKLKMLGPTREQKRKKVLLLEWFDDNWERIKDTFPLVILTEVDSSAVIWARLLSAP